MSAELAELSTPAVATRRLSGTRRLLPLATLLLVLIVWQIYASLANMPPWLLPSPIGILDSTSAFLVTLPEHVGTTLYETLAGYGLAIAIGIPLAVLIVYSPILQDTIYPILLAFQSVPKVAIAPLLLLWIGYGEAPKIVVVFLVCFFPIVVATATGLSSTPQELLDVVRSLSATQIQIFLKIRFPAALPHIFVGLKVAITLAVVGAVIGEFVGSNRGLGYLILAMTSQMKTPVAFGAMVLLTVMSIVLFYAVEAVEQRLVPWSEQYRHAAQ